MDNTPASFHAPPGTAHRPTEWVASAGPRIAFDSLGAGPPIVLIHGFSQSRQAWHAAGFVEALVRAGRRVITIDLRGHGESDKPHDAAAYDLHQHAHDVVAVLDALAIPRADMLGYSMGGAVAMRLATDFAARCHSVAIGGAQPGAQDLAPYRAAIGQGIDAWLAVIEAHVGPLAEDARRMVLANDVAALKAMVGRDLPDMRDALAAGPVPLLFYAGLGDPVHDAARGFARANDIDFLSLPQANHMQAFFAAPQVVPAVLALTSRNDARRVATALPRTALAAELGLRVPVINAGMAFVAGPALAGAVSEAGGLGMLGGFGLPPGALRASIEDIRRRTVRPFGVDLIGDFVEAAHLDVLIEQRVAVAVFFWTLPQAADVVRLRAAGVRVWVQVGSVAEARAGAALGADAVIVQGAEAGGHNRSEAATFTLLPAVRDAVAPLPVIAAGGIVDGRGLVAALALGAQAAWCGTRFLASAEADAHPDYQARVIGAGVGDTVRTTLFGPEWPGQQARVLRNAAARDWAGREAAALALPPAEAGTMLLGGQRVPLPRFSAFLPTTGFDGDIEQVCLTAGESAGSIGSVVTAGAIIAGMAAEACQVLAGLSVPTAWSEAA